MELRNHCLSLTLCVALAGAAGDGCGEESADYNE